MIRAVDKALDDFYKQAPASLPSLKSADFVFNTVTGKTVGGEIDFYVFKLGASRERDVTNQVSYLYQRKDKPKTRAEVAGNIDLTEELTDTMLAAARAIKGSPSAAKLPFQQLTVQIAFGVKWDVHGGVGVPIQLVTVGVNAGYTKNSVQTVTLIFADPEKP